MTTPNELPRIGPSHPIPGPRDANYLPKRIEFSSPDRDWRVVYHTPREWHMGADGWQVQLFHRRRDVTGEHKSGLRVAGHKGFRVDSNFQPWSYDGKLLALVTWDEEPVFLYDVATRKLAHLGCRRPFVNAAQFAPDLDRLLIASAADGLLVDQAGEERGVVRWDNANDRTPQTFWMKSGRCFFTLARDAARGRTVLTFFRGEDGSFAEAHDLDPSDLVPYESEKYAELPRNRFCLVLVSPRGVGAVGSLLDTWNDVRFDRASGTLSLSVLRPVSLPSQEGGALLCDVEQRWVAVEIVS